jgi:hypothetical protein
MPTGMYACCMWRGNCLFKVLLKRKFITAMKRFFTLIVFAAFAAFATTACSKCYKCKQTVEIEVNGKVQQSETEEEFCTASQKEVKAKVSNGSRCSAA